MSRIRGIEAKILKLQKEVKRQQNKRNVVNQGRKDGDSSLCDKDDPEKEQIKDLVQKLPKLDKIFEVHRKIGEGTFSFVYLGSLRQHTHLPDSQKRWFAIKHLVPTAHPARIEHELKCLQDMGGKHNVIGVELCLRHLDTIVFVMPYIPHRKFSEYVGDMDADEVARYMHALLVALRHVHSFGVIHRDVKPSNFLYDRENRRYLLVDFGLAQRVCSEPPPAHAHSLAKRPRDEEDTCVEAPDAKRVALDLSVARARGGGGGVPLAAPPAPPPPHLPASASVTVPLRATPLKHTPKAMPKSASVAGAGAGAGAGTCACAGAGGVCAACWRRGGARAARAGTQGFRPPEVLLKSPRQGPVLDTWAAGVVLASVLTARYPFFRASDDVSALAELADLLGTKPLQRVALKLGRRIVMSAPRNGICLRRLARHLRAAPGPGPGPARVCARCRLAAPRCLCLVDGDQPTASADPDEEVVSGFPDSAFSLALQLLEPDPAARLTADRALRHPFLRHLPH